MGYILISKRRHGNPIVSWNISRREPGAACPRREISYLGVLDSARNELLKSKDAPEPTAEQLECLGRKGISYNGRCAAPRGPKAVFLRRIPINRAGAFHTQSVGVYRLLLKLASDSGFVNALQLAYGRNAEGIFALMCNRLDTRLGSYLVRDWARDTPFEAVSMNLSPKAVGNLLTTIEDRRLAFACEWYRACGSPRHLIEDSTHFCTRSCQETRRSIEEYGWDHHQEAGLRQINLMSLVSRADGLPVMYRAYPGSINDVSTFMETASEMEVVGPDVKREFVSDSGYFSNLNMARLIKNGDDFTIEGKWDSQTLLILEEKGGALASHGEYVTHGSYAYRYEPCEYKVTSKEARGGDPHTVPGYIYYSDLEHSQKTNLYLELINKWRETFDKYDFDDNGQAREWLDEETRGWGRYLMVVTDGDGKRTLALDVEKVEADTRRLGYHLVFCTVAGRTAGEVLEAVHSRDPVEKLWRTMKTDLDSKTLKTKLDSATLGKIFIVWGAAVLHRLLANALAKAKTGMGVNEALMIFNKAKLTMAQGKQIPQTMTAKLKEAIVKMKMEESFPEFECELEPLVEKRNAAEEKAGKPKRGRKPKYKLKMPEK